MFGTPMAAVLLAVELLLFEWKPRSFIPVAVAVLVAAVAAAAAARAAAFPFRPRAAAGWLAGRSSASPSGCVGRIAVGR